MLEISLQRKITLRGLVAIVSLLEVTGLGACRIVPYPGVLVGTICFTSENYPKGHPCYEEPIRKTCKDEEQRDINDNYKCQRGK